MRCAGRRRHGRPVSAQPAPPAHAQPKPRVVEAPRQAARRSGVASPPEARRAGGVPSPEQAFAAGGRRADAFGDGQNAIVPTAAPAWVQSPPAQPGPQRSYRPPSMEAWLPTQGQGGGGEDQEWLSPARADDERAPDQAPWGRPLPPGFAAPPSDEAPTAVRGWAHTQGQGPESQYDPPSFDLLRAAPTARLGATPYYPNLGPVPGPEGDDAEGMLAHMAALLPGFGAAPLPLQPDQAPGPGNGGPYARPGFYGAVRRTTIDSDASPKIAAWQGDAEPQVALKPEGIAVHLPTAGPGLTHLPAPIRLPVKHLPAPIRLPEDAGADGAAPCGAHYGVRLASPIVLQDGVAEGDTMPGADALPPRFRGRIHGFPAARADTADTAWGEPDGGVAGGEFPQGSQLGFETWGPEVGRRAAPVRQYRPPLVLGRLASRAMAAAASERQMDRAACAQGRHGAPEGPD